MSITHNRKLQEARKRHREEINNMTTNQLIQYIRETEENIF